MNALQRIRDAKGRFVKNPGRTAAATAALAVAFTVGHAVAPTVETHTTVVKPQGCGGTQVALLGPARAEACAPTASFYVSPTGSDSNNGASPGQAFLTLNKAYDTAACGQIVQMAAGNYVTQVVDGSKACSGNRQITFRPVRGGTVKFSGNDGNGPLVVEIDVTGVDHMAIDGSGGNVEIDKLVVDGRTGADHVNDFVLRATHTHVAIINPYIDGFKIVDNDLGSNDIQNAHFEDVLRFNSPSGESVTNGLVEGNLIHDAGHSYGVGSNPQDHSDGVQLVGTDDNITFRRNRFYNNEDNNLIQKADQGPITNIRIDENFFSDPLAPSTSYGLNTSDAGVNRPCDGCTLRYNTFANGATFGYISMTSSTVTNYVVTGNIFGLNDTTICSQATAAGVTYDYNGYANAANGTCGTHAVTGVFTYLDEAALNFRLTSNSSPAVDAGNPSYCPPDDIDGTGRPLGVRCDLGAQEKH